MATLHGLGGRAPDALCAELSALAERRPLALVMPALGQELEGGVLGEILEEVGRSGFVSELVLSMNAVDAAGVAEARRLVRRLPLAGRVLWNDGAPMERFWEVATGAGYRSGKGANVWAGVGAVLARGACRAVAVHDSDIVSYRRELLARLALPVLHPGLGYGFCKGYYARVGGGRMFGRLTRLFVAPLLWALDGGGATGWLADFRYPLAGEFAARADLLAELEFPAGWDLEVGLLCEVARRAGEGEVCQAELAPNYEHKHRASPEGGGGLLPLAEEIGVRLFAEAGVVGDGERAVAAYRAAVEQLLGRYRHDALANGLVDTTGEDSESVRRFAEVLAGCVGREPAARLPAWAGLFRARPELREALSGRV